MTNPRELKRRIATIRSIERTVDAMQKMSAARLARARSEAVAGRPYTNALVGLVNRIASTGEFRHPLLEVREDKGYMLLAIGADRGMCGSYNTNIVRAAAEFIATRHREKLYLYTIGRRIRHMTPRTSATIIRETLRFPRPLSAQHTGQVAAMATEAFLRRDVVRVYFLYTEFRSLAGNRPVVRRILPVMPQMESNPREWLFEPTPAEMLDRLLPRYVRIAARQAFIEAEASEQAARMVTMEQASVNARQMIQDLTLTVNRLRQNIITRELSDIVGTVEAMAGQS